MARYIDADELKERLEDFSKWCRDGRKQGVDFVLDCPLPNMPTADVAPRAEVAREIFEAIEKTVNDCVVDESLFKPAYFEFRKFNEHLAALKKKYTEAETDPPKGD